jgi:CO/xanthine dehydrogenase FAD-binding subunit
MSSVADHPAVKAEYPAIAQSLQLAASAQLRNMATLGGNVLQKTRCSYFRDPFLEQPATSVCRALAARPLKASTAITRCWVSTIAASRSIPATSLWRWWRSTLSWI